jgi:hypothetical protein
MGDPSGIKPDAAIFGGSGILPDRTDKMSVPPMLFEKVQWKASAFHFL